jgi:hypothetical protein
MTGFRVTQEFLTNSRLELTKSIESTDVEFNQPLEITAYPLNDTLDLELRLTGNATGLPIPNDGTTRDANGAGELETLTFANPQWGTTPYTVGVLNTEGTRGKFLLEANSENPDNDSAASAPQIGNLVGSQTYNGFVGRSDRTDWYNFRLPSDSQVSVQLTGLEDNADLELYESNGSTLILRSRNSGIGDENIDTTLDAGNYLVKVSSNDLTANLPDNEGASTKYSLNLTQESLDGGGGGGGVDPITGVPVYRFFNTFTGTHFYTANNNEAEFVRDNLTAYNYEGPSFAGANNGTPDSDPVYRFYNTFTGTHFYTISDTEAEFVRQNLPAYRDEGIAYQAFDTQEADAIPLYRFYNTVTGSHFYTPDATERDVVDRMLPAYNYEGVGYYVYDLEDVGDVSLA